MKKFFVSLFVVMHLAVFAQDHGHINIGAAGLSQNDPLIFENAGIFEVATNYVKTLTLATSGVYTGYYQGNITLTGLAATLAHAGPEPNAAALGSQIHALLFSVEGPEGGAFAFWDTGATVPTISLASGETGTNTWRVSENDGSPGSDPYGHIHGRRFTATKPGIYTVGFRAFDFSTNGVGGDPIHSPSEVIKIFFQAGVHIKSVKPDVDHTQVVFSAPLGHNWTVEFSDSPTTNTTWTAIGAPIAGDDYFHEVTDEEPAERQRFYRVSGDTP